MKLQDKFKIDLETGLRIDTVSPYEFGEDIIETRCLESFYLPKWNFETLAWEESASQEYIDSLKQATPEAEPVDLEQRVETIENIIVEILEV